MDHNRTLNGNETTNTFFPSQSHKHRENFQVKSSGCSISHAEDNQTSTELLELQSQFLKSNKNISVTFKIHLLIKKKPSTSLGALNIGLVLGSKGVTSPVQDV